MAPFMADLDRCCESFNTLDDPSVMIFNLFDRLSAPNKANYVNLQVLIMITRFNNWKSLLKQVWRDYRCRLVGKNCNSEQRWNNNKKGRMFLSCNVRVLERLYTL